MVPVVNARAPVRGKVFVLSLFIVLAFALVSYAQGPSYNIFGANWESLVLLAVLTSYMIVALAYAIGIGFRYPSVISWAKQEFLEASLTAMLIVVFLFLTTTMETVSTAIAGGNAYDIAFDYLNDADSSLDGLFARLVIFQGIIGAIASLSFSFYVPLPILPAPFTTFVDLRLGTTLPAMPSLDALLYGVGPVLYMVYATKFAIYAQKVMLFFSGTAMKSFFLPMGLIFRAFPITRKMGGTIIAMALALYFVLPIALAVNTFFFDELSSDWEDVDFSLNMPFPEIGLDIVPYILTGQIWALFLYFYLGYSTVVMDLALNWVVSLSHLFMSIFFLFILDVIIVITSFRAIAYAVGGEPMLMGMGKLGI